MILFDDFEAVKFLEEDLILITNSRYIYYIYNPKYNWWHKYRNAGNDSITTNNYQEISRKEIIDAMGGKFPTKETDFMRLCIPSQLCIRDMMNLLLEDYEKFMSDRTIYSSVHMFLLESDVTYKSYLRIRQLFDTSINNKVEHDQILSEIKNLSFTILGRDIFKKEIGIVDGHDSSSYFWIMPVRVIDYEDTDDIDSVSEMRSNEISIEESDVDQYLTPFLFKYYDDELEANKKRVDGYYKDDDGNEHYEYKKGFEWYLTHNFFTYESIEKMIKDINDTIDALSSNIETEYTRELRIKRGFESQELIYAKGLTPEQIKEYNDNRPKEDDTEAELIIDFYKRFVYRMEYMMKVGKEKGYDLISFMGP